MAISGNRMSTYTQVLGSGEYERPKSSDTAKRDMWSSMLDSVASGKRLPEKNILVLGGSSDAQKEFLEALSYDTNVKKAQGRHGSRQPPIANNLALGYTYYDVLDTDHEDTLARLSLYLLADPSVSFTPLLRPLLTPQTIPNTLVVILLDWSLPWLWLRQLRDWVRLLRSMLASLDERCKEKMKEVMISWRDRGRGTASLDTIGSNVTTEDEVTLPLGPGEWDEALGLPLCVVCQNSDHMEKLEKERAWREEEFDFVLQNLRTVLLKHGGSLIYTIPSLPSPLQSLIYSSLSVQSSIKKRPLKHNVIDRDKVVLPPNWDSWGKIRVLREGFDVEGVNRGWSIDIDKHINLTADVATMTMNGQLGKNDKLSQERVGAVAFYEGIIRDPGIDLLSESSIKKNRQELDIQSQDAQSFLINQFEALEKLRKGAKSSNSNDVRDDSSHHPSQLGIDTDDERYDVEDGRVSEHIGPVQFNMGGIQVDADDMLQRLKDRQNIQIPGPDASAIVSPDGKAQNEALASFFAGLLGRSGGNATSSLKPGTS